MSNECKRLARVLDRRVQTLNEGPVFQDAVTIENPLMTLMGCGGAVDTNACVVFVRKALRTFLAAGENTGHCRGWRRPS